MDSFANSLNFNSVCYGFVALGLIYWLFFYDLGGKDRAEKVKNFALRSGLSYGNIVFSLPNLESLGMEIFLRGFDRTSSNIVIANCPRMSQTWFLDYVFIYQRPRIFRNRDWRRENHEYTVGLFEYTQHSLPSFFLFPDKLMNQVAAVVDFRSEKLPGFSEIEILDAHEFSKIYKIDGAEPNAVQAFFTPPVVSFFEKNPGWHVFVSGNYIAVYKKEGLVPVSEYQQYMESVKNLVSNIIR